MHVIDGSGLSGGSNPDGETAIAEQRRLLEEFGGTYRRITGSDVGAALIEVARSENATQIVLGASGRSWWHQLANGSVVTRVVRRSGPIDVHVISARPDEDGGPLTTRVSAGSRP